MRNLEGLLIVLFLLCQTSCRLITNNEPSHKNTTIDTGSTIKKEFTFFLPVEYSNDINPDTMFFNLDNERLIITPNGKVFSHKSFLFDINPEGIISKLFLHLVDSDVVVAYVFIDGEGNGGSSAKRISISQNKIVWETEIYAFNLTRPLVLENFAYLSTLGFIGKLNLIDGRFVWKHEDLNKKRNYECFNEPEFVNDSIIVFTNDYQDEIRDSIFVNDKNGKIIKMIY